jgi:hypothetical protein
MEYTEEIVQEYLDDMSNGTISIYDNEFEVNEDRAVIDMVCVVERWVDVDDTESVIEKYQICFTEINDWLGE